MVRLVPRGIFGRVGDGRNLSCLCHGCCGRDWVDFPDTINGRIYSDWLGGDGPFSYTGLLYKDPPSSRTCTCGKTVGVISYSSQYWSVHTSTWPEDDSESCCVAISIQGTCSNGTEPYIPPGELPDTGPGVGGAWPPLPFGECGWTVGATWTGGDPLAAFDVDITPVPENTNPFHLISCDPIAWEGGLDGFMSMPACILGRSGGIFGMEIREDALTGTGTAATACKFLCCETLDDTLFATIESDCPAIQALYESGSVVIELRKGNKSWVGELIVGACEVLRIAVYQTERQAEADDCGLQITVDAVGKILFTANCLNNSQELGSAPACPPWSVAGTIAEGCGCSCGGYSISIDITL